MRWLLTTGARDKSGQKTQAEDRADQHDQIAQERHQRADGQLAADHL